MAASRSASVRAFWFSSGMRLASDFVTGFAGCRRRRRGRRRLARRKAGEADPGAGPRCEGGVGAADAVVERHRRLHVVGAPENVGEAEVGAGEIANQRAVEGLGVAGRAEAAPRRRRCRGRGASRRRELVDDAAVLGVGLDETEVVQLVAAGLVEFGAERGQVGLGLGSSGSQTWMIARPATPSRASKSPSCVTTGSCLAAAMAAIHRALTLTRRPASARWTRSSAHV